MIDTPIYRWGHSGRQMVAEREAIFKSEYGFPSNALASQNFLTFAQLLRLADHLQTRYRIHHQASTVRRIGRRVKSRLKRQRETAEFPLIVWEKL